MECSYLFETIHPSMSQTSYAIINRSDKLFLERGLIKAVLRRQFLRRDNVFAIVHVCRRLCSFF